MATVNPRPRPITEANLRSFFHDSLQSAANNQGVAVEEATLWYLTNLLTNFSRSEQLFDRTENGQSLTPLVALYAWAAEAPTEAERKLALQRLGDVALFISGLFSGLFVRRRRLVDVDYYIAMGGSAYGYLSENSRGSVREQTLAVIFHELSREFARLVDVLAEVGENAPGADKQDVLRMHELWSKTASARLERKLRALGITPVRLTRTH